MVECVLRRGKFLSDTFFYYHLLSYTLYFTFYPILIYYILLHCLLRPLLLVFIKDPDNFPIHRYIAVMLIE